jgi:hypothetical protein
MPLRKIFEVSGSAKSKNVPSIAGSSRVEDGCCHLPRTCSVEAERCGDANGRVVCFSSNCKTSSLIASQPYACHTIHSWQSWELQRGLIKRHGSNKSNAVLRVAKKVEVIGSAVIKMTNCTGKEDFQGQKSQRRKKAASRERCRQSPRASELSVGPSE